MADDERLYSDEEFALILRRASERASRTEPRGPSSAGLTLTEMKEIAAQVGLAPALVENAARLVASRAEASPLERLIGGPWRHRQTAHLPIRLDETSSSQALSAVRISAGHPGEGHSSSMGMTWHTGGEFETFSVTARPEEDGTLVSVVLDRRGTLGLVVPLSAAGMFLAFAAGTGLYDVAPALGVGGCIAGVGGVLALARGYWAASTRGVRDRIDAVMDALGQALSPPVPPPPGVGRVGGSAAVPGPSASESGPES